MKVTEAVKSGRRPAAISYVFLGSYVLKKSKLFLWLSKVSFLCPLYLKHNSNSFEIVTFRMLLVFSSEQKNSRSSMNDNDKENV
jgi:hypothetical protein